MTRIRTVVAGVLPILACGRGDGARDTARDSSVAQAGANVPALGAGEAFLSVPGGRLWYKKSGSGSGIPVILLHGGPGYNSFYLKPLEALGSDRPVIRYDQLGSGKSEHVSDTTLFTIPHFVRELDSLRSALGYDRVHIVGHSWGTILGLEYYRAHPEHVASLTLASAALDIPAWERNARQLVKTLSDSSQKAIAVREAAKQFDAPDYQHALRRSRSAGAAQPRIPPTPRTRQRPDDTHAHRERSLPVAYAVARPPDPGRQRAG
jgi:proline-specific peptidase